jgi:uncharacterized protein YqiB (DUF1249 family)
MINTKLASPAAELQNVYPLYEKIYHRADKMLKYNHFLGKFNELVYLLRQSIRQQPTLTISTQCLTVQ